MPKSATPEQIGTRILNPAKKRQTSLVTALSLSSAAVGWSSLSHATDGQSDLQTLILPDTYSSLDDGTVILQLETGEQLTLTADQYVMLDGGLLLVVDELAQNSVAELPVLGSLRTQLLTEVQPVRSPDGTIVQATNQQPLWSGEGPAPRLFEEIDIQRFEIAQDQQEEDEDDEGAFLGGAGGALAGIGITTLGIMNTGANDESRGESPVWVSGNWPTSPENQVTTSYRLRATDGESTKLAYSIVGGADAEKFGIVDGVLTFVTAPDFEAPTDATTPNPDNIYEVKLRATDRDGNSTDQMVNVSVTNVNEPPVFTSTTTSFSVEENHTTTGYTGTATDGDNDVVTFSLDSTKDASAFTITSDGELSFSPSADYETPTDGSGSSDNTYEVDVIASDGNGGTATQSVSVTVTNGNDSPEMTSASTTSVPENTATPFYTVMASDQDGDTCTFVISGGADETKFVLVGNQLKFDSAPDFESNGSANGNNAYEVEITISDGNGGTAVETLIVNVTNVNEPPVFTSTTTNFTVEENKTATGYTGSATDPENDTITFSLGSTKDESAFTISSAGVLSFSPAADYELPTDGSGFPDNTYEIDVIASDGNGGTATQSVSVSVTDVSYEPWAIVWQGFGLLRGKSGGEIEPLPDLNGDGKPELLFQYEEFDSVYLVWSDHAWSFKNQPYPSDGSTQLGLYYLDEPSEGIQLMGWAPSSESIGNEIDTSGDVDGDGINDVLITEKTATPSGSNSGATYLIFGDYLKWAYENQEDFIPLDLLHDITYGINNDKVAGLVFEGSQANDRFTDNAFFMDFDGDSQSEIVFRHQHYQDSTWGKLTHLVNGKFLEDYSKQLPVSPLELGIDKDNFYNNYIWDDSGTTKDAGFAIDWDDRNGFGHGRSTRDISGDGFDDLLIGQSHEHESPRGYGVGDYYLFTSEFLSGITDKFDFTTPSGLNSQNGAFRITSDAPRKPGSTSSPSLYNGITLSRYEEPHVAEDIDGDGFPEIVFGIEGASFNDGDGTTTAEGAAVLIWGGFINERLTDSISNNEVLLIEDVLGAPFTNAAMPTWDGGARKAGVVFKGEAGEYLGSSSFSLDVGDFDGNGQNDLLIGHPGSKMHANGESSLYGGSAHVVWGEYLINDPEPANFAELRASADTVSIIPDSPFIKSTASQIYYGSEVEVLDFDGDGYDDIVTRAENAWTKSGNAYSGGGHIISGQVLDHMRPSNPEELTNTGLIVFEENRVPLLFDSDGDLLIS